MNSINIQTNPIQALIFTDLDGSLLDHFNYNTEPASPLLDQLEARNIPVIFATSKTFSEALQLREQLDNQHPFIVENGAAVFIPKGYFFPQVETRFNASHHPDFLLYSFCENRCHWLDILEKLKPTFTQQFTHFQEMGTKGIAKATGLSAEHALMANDRQFSEPVKWLGNANEKENFIDVMRQNGANIEEGGRFLHLIGHCNKGTALSFLYEQYQTLQDEPILSIALGDGKNDIPMLSAADHAVLIRSPVHPFPVIDKEALIKTDHYGPHGWVEGIKKILDIN